MCIRDRHPPPPCGPRHAPRRPAPGADFAQEPSWPRPTGTGRSQRWLPSTRLQRTRSSAGRSRPR
eukprot:12160577-Alexandrium_andersonii.AAC.1